MENKNPYSNDDGTPKTGFATYFLEWERKNEIAKLNSLPENEKKEYLESMKNLHDKMNS